MIQTNVYIPPAYLFKVAQQGPNAWSVVWQGLAVTQDQPQSSAHVTMKHLNRMLRRLAKQQPHQIGLWLLKWQQFLEAATDPTGIFNPVWTTLP